MRARGEIEWLSYISEPDLSVITSSGTSHIELLGSTQNVFKAKTEILLHTKNCCVLPSTKDFFEYECGNLKKIYVGNGGDYCIEEKRQHEDTVTFKINGCEFSINSTYSHNADNALFAYATGKYYGLDDEKIKVGLKKWRQRENRGSAFVYKGIKIINDCYNASYESVLSAIHSLSNHKVKNGQLAVLLGDMLELGNCAEQFHYNVGIACKENGISHLFAIGEHAQEYIKGFGGGTQLEFGGNIAARVINELRAGDVLLIKASHAMGFEKIIEDMREE